MELGEEILKMQGITKEYEMGEETSVVLKGIDLSVRRGEFLAVLGPSGSGKSTLMNIIGCLDVPTNGDYWLHGKLIADEDETELARIRSKEVGFIFQSFHLLQRQTAFQNVELPMIYNHTPARERREKAMEALKAVGLAERAYHLPNQLSGGQQQRVAIARSLVCDAPIIFADEPTGNLDTKMSIEVMDLFTRLNKEMGKTIILITHEPDIAQYATRLIKFKDGQKVSDEVKKC